MSYVVKIAETEEEFDALRRLNHDVFAVELGQHETTPDGLLADRFESTSRYFIAKHTDDLVGMLCIRDQRPFSIEQRLARLDILDGLPRPQLEVRLLALNEAHRNRMALSALLGKLLEFALEERYATILISGVTTRLEMYRSMGFAELGPAVPDGAAVFVPMALELKRLPPHILDSFRRYQRRTS